MADEEKKSENGVYVVVRGEYSDWNIVGVFRDKELMEQYILSENDPNDYEPLYCAGFYRFLDDDTANMPTNPIRYITKFIDVGNRDSVTHLISLDKECTQQETRLYDAPKFVYNHPGIYTNGSGFIVLDQFIDNEDRVLKIIIDKVYEQLANKLNVIAADSTVKEES